MRSNFKPYEYIPSYERRRRREWAERAFAFTLATIATVCVTSALTVYWQSFRLTQGLP